MGIWVKVKGKILIWVKFSGNILRFAALDYINFD